MSNLLDQYLQYLDEAKWHRKFEKGELSKTTPTEVRDAKGNIIKRSGAIGIIKKAGMMKPYKKYYKGGEWEHTSAKHREKGGAQGFRKGTKNVMTQAGATTKYGDSLTGAIGPHTKFDPGKAPVVHITNKKTGEDFRKVMGVGIKAVAMMKKGKTDFSEEDMKKLQKAKAVTKKQLMKAGPVFKRHEADEADVGVKLGKKYGVHPSQYAQGLVK